MKTATIHNGRFSYVLEVDGHKILFQGGRHVEYFKKHYESLGYEVTLTGDGK